MNTPALPQGRLVSWYGDDFTGSAAVMEVLSFGGIDSVLFLDVPTPAQLARFSHCRGIGIGGVARSQSPAWMEKHLPAIYQALVDLGAPLAHYKICSTLDSSPSIGSIGRAVELAQPYWRAHWSPLLVAAPDMGRYQAFAQLFATSSGTGIHRIDRHPVMSRHPVTPMEEADVRRHLARQTDLQIAALELPALRSEQSQAALQQLIGDGARVVALDCVDDRDLVSAGRLIWENRGDGLLAVGSQGVEYALLAYWRSIGAVVAPPGPTSVGAHRQILAVSGSASPITAEQLDWAASNSFAPVQFDAATVFDDGTRNAEIERVISASLAAIGSGLSVAIRTASGPDDPAIARFHAALEQTAMSREAANAAIGDALGTILNRLLDATGLKRAVISGGDTSGYAARKLGIHALTALAPTVPGAALCQAHTNSERPLELALKGGQMGSTDYFGWIRDGGGPRQ